MTTNFKRLSFERPGFDEDSRQIRTKKGILREITTPQFSIPLSVEGTELYKRVDRQDITNAVKNRNDAVDTIEVYKPAVALTTAYPLYSLDYLSIKQLIYIVYLGDGSPKVAPGVYQ